jgi:hypothetical protein
MEVQAYKEVYDRFRSRAYYDVVVACDRVIAEQPRNHLLAKYYMLKAMAVGGTKQVSAFREALNEVKNKFQGTDEAKAATELLAALDKSEGTPQPTNGKAATPDGQPPAASPFRDGQGKHYFVLVVPNADGPIDVVKTKISDFNKAYFPGTNIQITNSFLDSDHQVVLLSLFNDRDKAMAYYDLFLTNKDMLQGVNDKDYPGFAITPDNYSTLFKNKDVGAYSAFFTATYLNQ